MKFQSYLYGRSFVRVSDKLALYRLADLKNPSGCVACSDQKLKEFDVTVRHMFGRKYFDTDYLARLWTHRCETNRMTPSVEK